VSPEPVFVATVAAVAVALLAALRQLEPRWAPYTNVCLVAWLAFSAALAGSGWLAHFDAHPPHFLRFALPTWLAVVALCVSRPAGRLADSLPFAALVGYQVFRVPVEWVLFELARSGTAPPQMTFAGWNFDALTGLSAPLVAWLAARGALGRRALLAWNLAGLALLVNVVTIAVLSTPTPLRVFTNEPASRFLAYWPWVWLPGFLVPAALAGHLLLFRKLRRLR
jgi:hypothetical protein